MAVPTQAGETAQRADVPTAAVATAQVTAAQVTAATATPPAIAVATFDDLLKNEAAIVARINAVKNGGHLFLTDPFRLLAEVGVVLSDAAHAEILKSDPSLQGFSGPAYDAVKRAGDQPVTFTIHGLFQGSRTTSTVGKPS